jgi:hypothetical protein
VKILIACVFLAFFVLMGINYLFSGSFNLFTMPSVIPTNEDMAATSTEVITPSPSPGFSQKPSVSPTPKPTLPAANLNGIISGEYCVFDYRNYLEKTNEAEIFFSFCEKNIPQIANFLNVNLGGRKAKLKFVEDGFAYCSGDTIGFIKTWDLAQPGFLLHEGTHFVQNYKNPNPIWVTDGLADLVRFRLTKKSDEPGWAIGCMGNQDYTSGYGCAAAFFSWMGDYCGQKSIHIIIDGAMREGTSISAVINNVCAKTIEDLWTIYKSTNPPERIYPLE